METRMRGVVTADADDVARLLDLLGYPCSRSEASERISRVMDDPRQSLLVADINGRACGLVSIYTLYSVAHGADIARITAFVVAADCQRQGLGRQMLNAAESVARRSGASRIEVSSARHREEAHRFYRDCGYLDGSVRFVKHLGDA
jgi:GNAT superfamily N-acetyltransferase